MVAVVVLILVVYPFLLIIPEGARARIRVRPESRPGPWEGATLQLQALTLTLTLTLQVVLALTLTLTLVLTLALEPSGMINKRGYTGGFFRFYPKYLGFLSWCAPPVLTYWSLFSLLGMDSQCKNHPESGGRSSKICARLCGVVFVEFDFLPFSPSCFLTQIERLHERRGTDVNSCLHSWRRPFVDVDDSKCWVHVYYRRMCWTCWSFKISGWASSMSFGVMGGFWGWPRHLNPAVWLIEIWMQHFHLSFCTSSKPALNSRTCHGQNLWRCFVENLDVTTPHVWSAHSDVKTLRNNQTTHEWSKSLSLIGSHSHDQR